jgi:membrane protease subunit HflK
MADKKNPWARGSGGGNSGGGMGGGGLGGGNKPGRDYEKLLRDQHARMKSHFGDGNEKRIAVLAFAGIAVLWAASGIYRVNPDELGVVLRFGKYERIAGPGLNYHLPSPIERVVIPSVTTVNKVEIGRSGSNADNPSIRQSRAAFNSVNGVPQLREGQMLTGDRNIVDVDFEVQWKIDASGPEKFLFNMRDPAANVKSVAESAMREVIGRRNIQAILTTERGPVEADVKQLMQDVLNSYGAGVSIRLVQLQKVDPPAQVIDAFRDVQAARQDQDRARNEAETYASKVVPEARGEAARIQQEAEAYRERVVAEATGQASRFNQIYVEYKKSPEIIRERMFLETMERVLAGTDKMIIDQNGMGQGVVPYLPLNELQKKPQAGAVK